MDRVCNGEVREQRFAEQAWLTYFNRYLREAGSITSKQYECMVEKIAARGSKMKRSG